MKKTFKQFLAESQNKKVQLAEMFDLFEHEVYKQIPGSKNSYREDPGNTNTLTQTHSHAFAKLKGKGKELYAVNFDGSGHDGSSGMEISKVHADFFRSKGYAIPADNVLESIDVEMLDDALYEIVFIDDTPSLKG